MLCAAILNANDAVGRKHFGISTICATCRRFRSRKKEGYGTIASPSFEYSSPSVDGAILVGATCVVNYDREFSSSGGAVAADD